IGGAGDCQPTAVEAEGRAPSACFDRNEVDVARDRHGAPPALGGSVPELTLYVEAPAIRGAHRRDRARMAVSGTDGGVAPAARDAHRLRSTVRGRVAELAFAIGSPAIGGAVRRDPAGVETTRSHRGKGRATHHTHGSRTRARTR